MIDAHCHIDFARFDADRAQVLAAARAVGVARFLCAGVRPEDWQRQALVATQHEGVDAFYGIHPHVAAQLPDTQASAALERLAALPTMAIGETGLDGSKYVPRGSLERQSAVFRAQLAIARDRNLPVVLHILQAHGASLEILKQDGLPEAGGMVHSYSGSAELIRDYERLGLHVSFSASVTRKGARRVLAAVAAVSSDRLLVETDCPDQLPTGVVGSRNLPEYLPLVVQAVASAREETPELIATQTAANARRLFDLK
ncbi:MAG: TatD DNase family protein [Myxococcota bacterium]